MIKLLRRIYALPVKAFWTSVQEPACCRGIGASLSPEEIDSWEKEHLKMLAETTPAEFDVLHYAAMAILEIKKMGR